MISAHVAWLSIAFVLMLAGPALAQSGEAVAVLTEARKGGPDGEIRVKLAGKDEWRAPQPLMSLTVGDEIRVKGALARAVIVYTGGASTTITASNSPLKVARPTTSGGIGRQVASIFGGMAQFLLGKEKEPVYTQLATRSLRKDKFVILSPRDTRLTPDQLKFTWTGGPERGKYSVRVSGPAVNWSQDNLDNKPVAYPADAPRLQAGVRYLWEVRTAALSERAHFELVSDEEWKRIKQQLDEIKPVPGSPTVTTLARVTVLFQERLYVGALDELTAAIAADKTEPNLQFMLGHVYDRMGLRELAAAAFDQAQKLSSD
jgi:hypothetical protein